MGPQLSSKMPKSWLTHGLLFLQCSDLCATCWYESLSVNPHPPPPNRRYETCLSLSSHFPSGTPPPPLLLPGPPVRQGVSARRGACGCLWAPLSGYLATPTVFAQCTCGNGLHSGWRLCFCICACERLSVSFHKAATLRSDVVCIWAVNVERARLNVCS